MNNISYIGVQTYAYKGNHWSFTLLNIRGVKANGERVTIFDGSSTSVKTTNGDIGLLSNPNDAMLFYEFGQGGTVNYQTLTSLSNQEVTYIDPDSQLWKIKAGSGADIYSWNNILLPTSDTNVNLSFYDAISLDIDLSMGDWGDVERFFMEIELRYDDYGGTKYSRCKQYYLIDEDGNVTKSSTKIAKGFKGTVIALFEDFAINDNIMPHLYNIHNSSRIIIDTSGLDGVVFKLNNIRIILSIY